MLIPWLLSTGLAHAGDVNVITFNAWGLPAPIAPDRAGRLERASAWLGGLGADVIGLEEVWNGARPMVSLAGLHLPAPGRDSGLGLVSPHAVGGLDLRAFRSEHGIDSWKAKGILRATVALPDGEIAVFVTHMQAGDRVRDAAARADQVAELIEWMADVDIPALALGDFNLYTGNLVDQASAAQLAAAGLVDAAATVGIVDPTYQGYPDRYDRIYVRDAAGAHWNVLGAEVVRYDTDPTTSAPDRVSDHYPVTARFHLDRGAPAVAAGD